MTDDAIVQAGASATVTTVVSGSDTAAALGSGDLQVLGTPRLVALLEAAAVAAIRDSLSPTSTTVGADVSVTHRAPSAVGTVVHATATVVDVDGRRLTFTLEATMDEAIVATGRHVRVIVDRDAFSR